MLHPTNYKKYSKIKHSPGSAAPAGISPFASLSWVSSPFEEGTRETTSCIPGSRIFKEHENIYLDCPSCDKCLSKAFQQTKQ